MKISAFVATSVDGFLARPDGDIAWLPGSSEETAEDYGYKAFIDSVDILVMGRRTFEKALTFPTWPYNEKKVVVLSHRPPAVPHSLSNTVEMMAASPQDVAARLHRRGARHLYIDGGITIQSFLAAGLIQHLTITTVPVLLGSGVPLFGALPHDVHLRHIKTRTFSDGLLQSTYDIRK